MSTMARPIATRTSSAVPPPMAIHIVVRLGAPSLSSSESLTLRARTGRSPSSSETSFARGMAFGAARLGAIWPASDVSGMISSQSLQRIFFLDASSAMLCSAPQFGQLTRMSTPAVAGRRTVIELRREQSEAVLLSIAEEATMLFGHPVHKPWGMYDPAAELVDVVDEHGRTIGVVTRRELRERRLAHRSVYLLVFNARGEIFIHLRTATKDVSPSHWDLNIGGVLASGETYDEGARREALEELGVTLEPRPLFPFHFSDEHSTVHGMVYRAEHDGPFHLQAEEIVRGEFVTVEELERRLRTERFCPDGICVWRQFSMSAIKELSPSPRLLLGPGPCDAHPRVLRAMTTPLLGHLDPEFTRIMDETQELLRRVYQTNNPLTFAISGTGTAGMETCLVNLIEPGDRMLVCVNGFFGQRMSEIAQRAGANVTVLDRPWGEVFKLDQIRETINRVRPKVLGIVHAETSTGALQPMADLGRLCRDSDLLLLVDTVTSLGGVPVDVTVSTR